MTLYYVPIYGLKLLMQSSIPGYTSKEKIVYMEFVHNKICCELENENLKVRLHKKNHF